MKFTQQTNSLGQFSLVWERTEYDAFPPAAEFTADHAPHVIHPDRRAVALALLFSPWAGDEMTFPGRIGPNTAHEIRKFTENASSSIGPIEYYPKGLPIGAFSGTVANQLDGLADVKKHAIYDLPNHEFNGALRTMKSLAIGTNSFMFKRHESDIVPALGVGVLFAEDLGLDEFVISADLKEEQLTSLRRLLSAVRLGLSIR